MSLVKDAIKSLVEKGKITHDFEIHGMKFSMEVLTSEEQLLADSLVDPDYFNKKFKADNVNTFRDTMDKHRLISQMALAIRTVDGKSPVDKDAPLSEQFKQRVEFKDEIIELDVVTLDQLVSEYNTLVLKHREFLRGVNENVKK
jgi:hypothetical protein